VSSLNVVVTFQELCPGSYRRADHMSILSKNKLETFLPRSGEQAKS